MVFACEPIIWTLVGRVVMPHKILPPFALALTYNLDALDFVFWKARNIYI